MVQVMVWEKTMKISELLNEGVDYSQPGPITQSSLGQKLEYGIPVNSKGSFFNPNKLQNYEQYPDDEYMAMITAYRTWLGDYLKRWPSATERPDGTWQGLKPGLAPMSGFAPMYPKEGVAEAFENDESNMMYRFNPETGRLGQRMIHNNEERTAHQQGYRDSHEAALKVHGIIKSKFKPGKWVQKQGNSWPEVHPFGKSDGVDESATAGATSDANVGVGAVYNNKPVKQPKNKDGTAKNAVDMKGVNLLTGGSLKR